MDKRRPTELPGARRTQKQLDHLQPNWQRRRSQEAQRSPGGDKDVGEDP